MTDVGSIAQRAARDGGIAQRTAHGVIFVGRLVSPAPASRAMRSCAHHAMLRTSSSRGKADAPAAAKLRVCRYGGLRDFVLCLCGTSVPNTRGGLVFCKEEATTTPTPNQHQQPIFFCRVRFFLYSFEPCFCMGLGAKRTPCCACRSALARGVRPRATPRETSRRCARSSTRRRRSCRTCARGWVRRPQ